MKRKIVQFSMDPDGSGAWALADDGTMWRLNKDPLLWRQMYWPDLPPPDELAHRNGPTPSEPEPPGAAPEVPPGWHWGHWVPAREACHTCRNNLDEMIRYWRSRAAGLGSDTTEDRQLTECAPYYVDALQWVRMKLFGELLPREGELRDAPRTEQQG